MESRKIHVPNHQPAMKMKSQEDLTDEKWELT
jgi:hypothetical protein